MPKYSSLIDSKASKSTTVLPKYQPDGTGRDVFMNRNGVIPHTACGNVSPNKPQHIASKTKYVTAQIMPVGRFVPNGTGRDTFQQCDRNPIIASTGRSHFTTVAPKVKGQLPSGTAKTTIVGASYVPSGNGRDMYMVRGFTGTHTSSYGCSMRVKKYEKSPRPRTSSLPRYVSNGSGRDSFHNVTSHLNIKTSGGFNYGSESISQSARHLFRPQRHIRNDELYAKSQKESTFRLSRPSSPSIDRSSSPSSPSHRIHVE